jgi:hypothetical protein
MIFLRGIYLLISFVIVIFGILDLMLRNVHMRRTRSTSFSQIYGQERLIFSPSMCLECAINTYIRSLQNLKHLATHNPGPPTLS